MAPRNCAGFFFDMDKERVAVYIDGFNLYHSLVDAAAKSPMGNRLKWFDIQKMLLNKVSENKTIVSVKYFTALFPDAGKSDRHKRYIKVLEDTGIEVVHGRFKPRIRYCPRCKRNFNTHEEKRTDVNIALHLLNDFYSNTYDTAIIVSGDTDLIPAIHMIKKANYMKKIGIIFPYNRFNKEFRGVATFLNKIKMTDIETAILPDPYVLSSTGVSLTKPTSWS